MTTARDEENLRPSMVRYSLETTSVGRVSAPSGPGWPVPPAVERNGHAPVQVPGDRPRLQVVEEVEGELEHVRPPVARLGLQPAAEDLGESGQVQEVVLGLAEDRRLAVDLGPRVD